MPAHPWRYDPEASRRDLRLDFLRGVCLFKMVFNHLWRTPLHPLQSWLGYVSAAEGFFFISGAVVGIVHGRRARQRGLATAGRQVLGRATHLYLANLALVFFFLALETSGLLGENRFFYLWRGESFNWWLVFNLNQPYLLHVLTRYVVFLALTPLALWCLLRGRGRWLLAGSLGLWGLNLAAGGELKIPLLEASGYQAFPILAWQLLFFAGMAVGFHRRRLAGWWRSIPVWRLGGGLGLVCLAFVALNRGTAAGLIPLSPQLVDLWLGRDHLGPARLVNVAAVFAFTFLAVDVGWRPLSRWLGPVLLPMGQHALYLFLAHLLVVCLGLAYLSQPALEAAVGAWGAVAANLAVLGLLWAMIKRRFLFGFLPN